MDTKLQSLFEAVEETVQQEVNTTFANARLSADKRIYDMGYDAACREHKVGKYAAN